MKNYIIKILCIESAILLLSIFLLTGCTTVYAADLSTDPMDGAVSSAAEWGSSASVENSSFVSEDSQEESSASSVDNSADDSSSSSPDIIMSEPVDITTEPDTIDESDDVVVNRVELQEVVDLLNDLSAQLALYAAEVPAGYEPTEEDYAYRADLLETLSGIHESLLLLTEPAPVEPEIAEQETVPEEETASVGVSEASAEVSAPADESAPVETDPADTETDTADHSAAGDSSAPSEITQQDFYKLVLGFLFLVCLWPVLTWVYRFLSSFIPV